MKKLILLLVSLSLFLPSKGNDNDKLTIGHKGMSFIEFAQEMQNKYNVALFYEPSWVKDIELSKSYVDAELKDIMQDILSGFGLEFLIRGNYVIITANENLEQSFRPLSDSDKQKISPAEQKEDKQLVSLKEQEYIIHEIGTAIGKKKVKLYGYVIHYESQSPLKGVEIFLPNLTRGVTSNKDGYYELQLSPGNYLLHFKYMGLKETSRKINLRGDGRLDVQMVNTTRNIQEVRVLAKDDKVRSVKMGLEHIDAATVRSLPAALGEPDIIKSTTMLPGVESAGEGAIGFNVRGGSTDQNLILVDNAPIYYPAHFFGFFSAFNSDIIKEANLYKSSIPTQFGGRISSAYDIHTRENGIHKFKGKVGISPVTSKLYFESPIVKNKLSIVNSFRFTYSNWILKMIDSKELINSKADFYDLHGKIIYKPNQNNQIELSYYKSQDEFKLHSDTLYNISNLLGSINYRTRFNEKLGMNNSIYYSSFSYEMSTSLIPNNAFQLTHLVQEIGAKSYFTYTKSLSTSYDFGVDTKLYNISPGDMEPNSGESSVERHNIAEEKGLETALFLGAKYDITSRLSAETGIRYSLYGNPGSKQELVYLNNQPVADNIIDTVSHSGGLNNIFHGPEYRLSMSYEVDHKTSLKASYNRTRQYIHLLSNTTSISPTDNWKLSDRYMKPQIGDQFSLGFYRNFNGSAAELSIEAYYKKIQNAKDYKNGAQLYLNDHPETEVINGKGKSYGIEFLLKKKTGRIKGSVSYTYSRSYLKSKEKTGEFAINNGDYYPAPFDKPHNFKTFLNLNLSRRFILSTNLVYHTGRPATYPISRLNFQNIPMLYYSNRNEYRLPDYFRMDLSLLMEGSLKKDKRFHSTLALGVYNLTGRRNAYSVYFKTMHNTLVGYKLSIFGQAIPTITYNLEF